MLWPFLGTFLVIVGAFLLIPQLLVAWPAEYALMVGVFVTALAVLPLAALIFAFSTTRD